MTTTTMSLHQREAARTPRRAHARLLVEIPVANVGIFAFAAFLAVGAEGVEIVFLARVFPGKRTGRDCPRDRR